MSQCLILNISGRSDWREQLFKHGKYAAGIHIPAGERPTLIQPDRESAEKEAARLACQTGGTFAVFELIATCTGHPLGDSELSNGTGPFDSMVPKWQSEKVEI